MRLFAGLLGALLGAIIGVLLVEVVFANNQSWPDVVPVALAVLGWLAGTTLVQRTRQHRGASLIRR
jgi:hypothetical protein